MDHNAIYQVVGSRSLNVIIAEPASLHGVGVVVQAEIRREERACGLACGHRVGIEYDGLLRRDKDPVPQRLAGFGGLRGQGEVGMRPRTAGAGEFEHPGPERGE